MRTIARATTDAKTSPFGTPSPASTPTSAAGTTPVSRVQHRKTSSLRDQRSARTGNAHTSTVSGRATSSSVASTARAGSRLSPSVSNGMFAPRTMNTINVTMSARLNANWRTSSMCGSSACPSPRCSLFPTISPARNAPR